MKMQFKLWHIVSLPYMAAVVNNAVPPFRICSQLCLSCFVLTFHHSRNSVKNALFHEREQCEWALFIYSGQEFQAFSASMP